MIVYTANPKSRGRRSSYSKKKKGVVTKRYRPEFKEMKSDPYRHLPSNRGSESLVGGNADTSKKENPVYTGDKLIGISIVHKSCLQPVFSREDAEDFSRMRR